MVTYEQRIKALADALGVDEDLIENSGYNTFTVNSAPNSDEDSEEYMVLDYDEIISETASKIEDLYNETGWVFDGFSPSNYADEGEIDDRIRYDKEYEVADMTDDEVIRMAEEYGLIDDDNDDDDDDDDENEMDIDAFRDYIIDELVDGEDRTYMTEEWAKNGELNYIDFNSLAEDIVNMWGYAHELSDYEEIELDNDLYAFKI